VFELVGRRSGDQQKFEEKTNLGRMLAIENAFDEYFTKWAAFKNTPSLKNEYAQEVSFFVLKKNRLEGSYVS
jgi:hypothetical protein